MGFLGVLGAVRGSGFRVWGIRISGLGQLRGLEFRVIGTIWKYWCYTTNRLQHRLVIEDAPRNLMGLNRLNVDSISTISYGVA